MARSFWREKIADLREAGRNACPFTLTFVECSMSQQERTMVEVKLKQAFDIWWATWIEPKIAEIERKTVKP